MVRTRGWKTKAEAWDSRKQRKKKRKEKETMKNKDNRPSDIGRTETEKEGTRKWCLILRVKTAEQSVEEEKGDRECQHNLIQGES